ncbi:hypothetical protein GCM10010273_16800 [Streptomyces lavendulocolor]
MGPRQGAPPDDRFRHLPGVERHPPAAPHTIVEYTYLKKNPDGTITWENGDNRTVFTTSFGAVTLNDIWR